MCAFRGFPRWGGAPTVGCLRTSTVSAVLSLGYRRVSTLSRRNDFTEGQTSEFANWVWLVFTGSSGIIVRLSTNHFRLTSRPQWALYQYHIDYNPLMEARRLRSALLFQHEDLIGRCHAFDGTILFLPKRLQHKVISDVGRDGEREVGDFHFTADLHNVR